MCLSKPYSHLTIVHDQGLVSESVLHEVMVAQLPGKSKENLQALQNTAVQVAASPTPSSINYIKLMTPVSKDKH